MSVLRVLPCGERAALVEVDSPAEVRGLYAALRADSPPGVIEVVPAARTVLVGFDPELTTMERLVAALRGNPVSAVDDVSGAVLEVPVRYDGPDLEEVARLSGLSVAEVIARHAGAEYTVAFCGFAPGFGYLTGLDPALRLPRREVPRTRVPVGSVALADEFTGVYPRASPGGWHLIGHTGLPVFDVERDPPALFAPGVRVRFTVVEAGL